MTINLSYMYHYLSQLGFYSPQNFISQCNLNPYNPSRPVPKETIHEVYCRK